MLYVKLFHKMKSHTHYSNHKAAHNKSDKKHKSFIKILCCFIIEAQDTDFTAVSVSTYILFGSNR